MNMGIEHPDEEKWNSEGNNVCSESYIKQQDNKFNGIKISEPSI